MAAAARQAQAGRAAAIVPASEHGRGNRRAGTGAAAGRCCAATQRACSSCVHCSSGGGCCGRAHLCAAVCGGAYSSLRLAAPGTMLLGGGWYENVTPSTFWERGTDWPAGWGRGVAQGVAQGTKMWVSGSGDAAAMLAQRALVHLVAPLPPLAPAAAPHAPVVFVTLTHVLALAQLLVAVDGGGDDVDRLAHAARLTLAAARARRAWAQAGACVAARACMRWTAVASAAACRAQHSTAQRGRHLDEEDARGAAAAVAAGRLGPAVDLSAAQAHHLAHARARRACGRGGGAACSGARVSRRAARACTRVNTVDSRRSRARRSAGWRAASPMTKPAASSVMRMITSLRGRQPSGSAVWQQHLAAAPGSRAACTRTQCMRQQCRRHRKQHRPAASPGGWHLLCAEDALLLILHALARAARACRRRRA